MARPEKRLDPNSPLTEIADELRSLRRAAQLTYRELAERTGVSASVLSTAASGSTLPKWEVIRSFVLACGGSELEWRRRWDRASRQWTTAAINAERMGTLEPRRSKDTSLARFARDLRVLHTGTAYTNAGLAMRLGCTASYVSAVLQGELVPDWPWARSFVVQCGGDPAEWRRRWEDVAIGHLTEKPSAANDFKGNGTRVAVDPMPAQLVREPVASRRRWYLSSEWASRLAKVTTQGQLSEELRELRRMCGLSYSQIERASKALSAPDAALPKSTLSDMLSGKTLPSEETLEAFLAVCGVVGRDTWQWVAARERVRLAGVRLPSNTRRVMATDSRGLGVHLCVDETTGLDRQPGYVPREFDGAVRTALTKAADSGGFVLLVGDPGAGKTRSAYEALNAVLPDWWLVQPSNADELSGTASSPNPQSVVWLDEAQRYLRDPRSTEAVRSLRRARTPVVVVGTMRSVHYQAQLTDQENGRQALDLVSDIVTVPLELTRGERIWVHSMALADPRIDAALSYSTYGPFQILAAGPDLVRRWELSPDAYSRSVITAAVDAYRMGAKAPLSADLLRAAAYASLTPEEKAAASGNWFEQALDYATATLPYGLSALSPVFDPTGGDARGYRAQDYLLRYRKRTRPKAVPPPAVWRAYRDHIGNGRDLRVLAGKAASLGLTQQAESLYQQAALSGESRARAQLVEMLQDQGRFGEAEALLWQALDAGEPGAREALVEMLQDQGRFGEAEALLWQALDAGEPGAREALVRLLSRLRRIEEAQQLLLDAGDTGETSSSLWLSYLLEGQGALDEAEAFLRNAMVSGEQRVARAARKQLAELRRRRYLARERTRSSVFDAEAGALELCGPGVR